MSESPVSLARDGVRIALRVSPRAKANSLLAVAEGGRAIKAAVTAPPEGGRANEALLRLLARAWRLPRRDLSIVAGATGRSKVVHIAGDPQRLAGKVAAAVARLPAGG